MVKETKGPGHSVSCTPSIKVPPNLPCSYLGHTVVSCRESAASVLSDNHYLFPTTGGLVGVPFALLCEDRGSDNSEWVIQQQMCDLSR